MSEKIPNQNDSAEKVIDIQPYLHRPDTEGQADPLSSVHPKGSSHEARVYNITDYIARSRGSKTKGTEGSSSREEVFFEYINQISPATAERFRQHNKEDLERMMNDFNGPHN